MATSGVGDLLRRERLNRRQSLEEIANTTRISIRFLKAIEGEDYASLPGLIFTRNFVRQYAAFLELDPAPILAMLPRVDIEATPMPSPPDKPRKSLWDSGWNSNLASLLWVLLAGVAAAGGYYYFERPPRQVVSARSETPAAPVPVTAVQTSAAPVANPMTTPETAPSAEPVSAPVEPGNHPVEVVVNAREAAWVQASADGKIIFAAMLKAGDSRAIAADQLVKIRTGNAGGVDISLNGKPIDPLGPAGQVRSVMLTAEGP